jgi:hypothetical protein
LETYYATICMSKTRNRRRKDAILARERVDARELNSDEVEFLAQAVARWIFQKAQAQKPSATNQVLERTTAPDDGQHIDASF